MGAILEVKKQYKGVFNIVARYWGAYGGLRALVFSPYFHMATLLTFAQWHYWINDAWWETVLAVVPSVLGFTLAGFTIWLGFGDEKFQRLISAKKDDKDISGYVGISAAFVHFIVVQFLALMAALIGNATAFELPPDHYARSFIYTLAPFGHFFGYLIFTYALMTALAATFGVFRTATWFDHHRRVAAQNAIKDKEVS